MCQLTHQSTNATNAHTRLHICIYVMHLCDRSPMYIYHDMIVYGDEKRHTSRVDPADQTVDDWTTVQPRSLVQPHGRQIESGDQPHSQRLLHLQRHTKQCHSIRGDGIMAQTHAAPKSCAASKPRDKFGIVSLNESVHYSRESIHCSQVYSLCTFKRLTIHMSLFT